MDVTVNGTRLWVTDTGEGHPVLFLHGLGCDGTDWQPQVEEFSDRYRCITIDHRGHGRSDRSVGDGFSIAGFASDAIGVLDHLGAGRTHVVGLSMGGMIAQQIAVTAPDRLCSLTLLDTYARAGDSVPDVAPMADLVEETGVEAIAGGFQAMVFAQATVVDKPDLVRRFEAQFAGNTAACLAAAMRAIAGLDVFDRLGSIRVPTIVAYGTEDLLTPASLAAELAGAIAEGRLEPVPDAGHFSNLENPAAVNKLIREQLERSCDHAGGL